jgi:hypothetical protein
MPDINAGKCRLCDKEKAKTFGYCDKCWYLTSMIVEETPLGKKAEKLREALERELINTECYIIKRDRLLHLQEIANDKYLTKLKIEVEKI